jgi:hypothetical protein
LNLFLYLNNIIFVFSNGLYLLLMIFIFMNNDWFICLQYPVIFDNFIFTFFVFNFFTFTFFKYIAFKIIFYRFIPINRIFNIFLFLRGPSYCFCLFWTISPNVFLCARYSPSSFFSHFLQKKIYIKIYFIKRNNLPLNYNQSNSIVIFQVNDLK